MNTKPRNLVLLFCATLTIMAGTAVAPALPAMEKVFCDQPNAGLLVNLVMTLPAIVIALCAPLIGVVIDKTGDKKWLLTSSILLFGVAGLSGYFFDQNLMIILIGRGCLGLAVAGTMVSGMALVGDYFEPLSRNQFIGLQAAFSGFGGVLFLAVGGALATLGWQYSFLLYAVAFALVPGVLRYIYNAPTEAPIATTTQPNNPLPKGFIALTFALAIAEITLLYFVALYFPFFMEQMGNPSPLANGLCIALMMLTMSSVALFYKRISARLAQVHIHALGFVLLGLGYYLLAYAANYAYACFTLALAGVGFGLLRPNLVAWLMLKLPPQVRGRVMGGLTTSIFIGQFASPFIAYPLVSQGNFAGVFELSGISALLLSVPAGLICLFTHLKQQRNNVLDAA